MGIFVGVLRLAAVTCLIVAIAQQWELVEDYVTDPWFLIRKLCDFLGKRMLCMLCMTDALADVIVAIHEGDEGDSAEMQERRRANVRSFSTLQKKVKSYDMLESATVVGDDEEEELDTPHTSAKTWSAAFGNAVSERHQANITEEDASDSEVICRSSGDGEAGDDSDTQTGQ